MSVADVLSENTGHRYTPSKVKHPSAHPKWKDWCAFPQIFPLQMLVLSVYIWAHFQLQVFLGSTQPLGLGATI